MVLERRGEVKGTGMWLKRHFQNLDVGTNRIKQSEVKKEAMAWQAQEWSRTLKEQEVVCRNGNAERKGRGVGCT